MKHIHDFRLWLALELVHLSYKICPSPEFWTLSESAKTGMEIFLKEAQNIRKDK
jgi:hypothetical protein